MPLAKLSLPRLAQGVPRPRLFALLDEARTRQVVWVAGPGGAGKTTLAATYLVERKLPYLWYQLDRDDVDPATFFYYLGIAARHVASGRLVHLPLLTPEYLPDLFGFARRFFRTLYSQLPEGLVLVLDNYQDLGEAPIFGEILRNGIAEVPPGSQLLILSRDEPPPSLSASGESDGAVLLDWEALRLTYDETRAIAAQEHALDERAIHALHRRADGWPAAVTLLLEQMERAEAGASALEGGSPDTIFQFFAGEFFNQLPRSTQEFLLRTALLPHMTPSMAGEVSGDDAAGHILADLHRRRFFIHRRDVGETSYQYHALFREFLLAKSSERYAQEPYLALSKRAAGTLSGVGRHEEATALLLQAQDWQGAAALLVKCAPRLLAQGRGQIVIGWLQQMPDEVVQSAPWLLFWKGMSHQFVDPAAAQSVLEEAYSKFLTVGDILGQMLAASGIIDIIFFLRDSLLKAERWADALQDLLATKAPPLPPAIEAQILASLFSILELLRVNDPQLPHYAARLLEFIDADIDDNQKMLIAPRLIIYYAVIRGDAAACEAVMLAAEPLAGQPHVIEVARIHWMMLSVLPAIHLGHKSQVRDAVQILTEFIRGGHLEKNLKEQNLLHLQFLASWYATMACLGQQNYAAADPLLDSMAASVSDPESIDMAIYSMAKALHALGQGDLATAQRFGEVSLRAHNSAGAMITGLDVYCLLALERSASGDAQAALGYLAFPKQYGTGTTPCLNHQVLLTEAHIHLRVGDREACRRSLRDALSIGAANRFPGFRFWLAPVMPSLFAEALSAGIEVEYVCRLVRLQEMAPPDSAPDNWPWPVRVFAFGSLRIEVDARELPQSQMQGKPLALLGLLIAEGGQDVRIEDLAEVLWPDSEGDAGLSAFTTTMSRLRKLIGEEAVVVHGGRVSLDERHCWLDVWALEHWLARSEGAEGAGAAIGKAEGAVLELYRGPFLPAETAAWAGSRRQRLRERMVQWRNRLVDRLYAAGDAEASRVLSERLAGADPALAADDHAPAAR